MATLPAPLDFVDNVFFREWTNILNFKLDNINLGKVPFAHLFIDDVEPVV